MSALPFETETEQEYFQFTKEIKIPIYGSPTVEEFLFFSNTQNDLNNISGLVDFCKFLLRSRCEELITDEKINKMRVKTLKRLITFFNRECESMAKDDEEAETEKKQTGQKFIGDSISTIPTKVDSVESNSGVAL